MKQRKNIQNYAAMLLWLAASLPAQAHPVQVPSDPAVDSMSDRMLTITGLAIFGFMTYYFLIGSAGLVGKARRKALDDRFVKSVALIVVGIAVLLIFHVSMPTTSVSRAATAHVDKPQHGGLIQSVGNNHIEAVIKKDGVVGLYIMGVTESLPSPVAVHTIWAKAQGIGGSATSVMLEATPQPDDPKGQASAFVGHLPSNLTNAPVMLSMDLPIDGQKQPVQFTISQPGEAGAVPVHDTGAAMIVAKKPSYDEEKLFLMPGGAYTQEDIAANGDTTPDNKYAGMMANHHLSPKKGTYTCPITKTQANPRFPWIVGGKRYLFCCPPCIAEFVKEAKQHPDKMRPPDSYIQG